MRSRSRGRFRRNRARAQLTLARSTTENSELELRQCQCTTLTLQCKLRPQDRRAAFRPLGRDSREEALSNTSVAEICMCSVHGLFAGELCAKKDCGPIFIVILLAVRWTAASLLPSFLDMPGLPLRSGGGPRWYSGYCILHMSTRPGCVCPFSLSPFGPALICCSKFAPGRVTIVFWLHWSFEKLRRDSILRLATSTASARHRIVIDVFVLEDGRPVIGQSPGTPDN